MLKPGRNANYHIIAYVYTSVFEKVYWSEMLCTIKLQLIQCIGLFHPVELCHKNAGLDPKVTPSQKKLNSISPLNHRFSGGACRVGAI